MLKTMTVGMMKTGSMSTSSLPRSVPTVFKFGETLVAGSIVLLLCRPTVVRSFVSAALLPSPRADDDDCDGDGVCTVPGSGICRSLVPFGDAVVTVPAFDDLSPVFVTVFCDAMFASGCLR